MAHNSTKWEKFHSVVGEIPVHNVDEGVLSDSTEWDPG